MSLTEALSIANELLNELLEDLSADVLKKDTPLQVLVEDNIIVDYYYSDEVERSNLLHERTCDESIEDVQLRKDAWLQYKKDKPLLKETTVQALIFNLNAFISYYSPKM